MTNRVFVDTSYMVALVNPRDQYHSVAKSVALGLGKRPLLTTDAVILSFVVMRREGITEALTLDRHFTQAGFRSLMDGPSNGRGRPASGLV